MPNGFHPFADCLRSSGLKKKKTSSKVFDSLWKAFLPSVALFTSSFVLVNEYAGDFRAPKRFFWGVSVPASSRRGGSSSHLSLGGSFIRLPCFSAASYDSTTLYILHKTYYARSLASRNTLSAVYRDSFTVPLMYKFF